LVFASGAQAQQDGVCRSVAWHLWSGVAPRMLQDQTAVLESPLAALVAAAPGAFARADGSDVAEPDGSVPGFQSGVAPAGSAGGGAALTKPGQTIADALIDGHAADPGLAAKLRGLPPSRAVRFGETDVWLLDRVDGTLGCHTPLTVVVPAKGAAHEVALPGDPDPTALCALSALTAVSIDGTPALWIEQSGAFSNAPEQSSIVVTAVRDGVFGQPCSVVVDYAMTEEAAHAFCDGIDCVALIRSAEILAMRLLQKETADSLGAGALETAAGRPDGGKPVDEAAAYQRMAAIVAGESQPVELPTFGASIDTPYTMFADQVVFPLRLDDGHVYLARMGHGGFGWRQTPDVLLALYRLRDDRPVAAASVYVRVRRSGIVGVTIE
jgi:hypothetical protein